MNLNSFLYSIESGRQGAIPSRLLYLWTNFYSVYHLPVLVLESPPLMYTDAELESDLQQMFDITSSYAQSWRYILI